MILSTNHGDIHVAARTPNPYQAWALPESASLAGRNVTPEDSLSLASVYGAVSLIAHACGTMPLEVIDTGANGSRRIVQNGYLAPMLRFAPNSDMSGADVWTLVFAHLMLRGNAYLAKLKDDPNDPNRVTELLPIRPDFVFPYRNWDGQKIFRVRIYRGTVYVERDFTPDAILHIKGLSFGDGLVGAGPIEILRNRIGTHLSQSEYQARAYQDGMLIKGVLSTPERNISPDAAQRIKQQWRSAYGGVGNSHDIAVLHSGIQFQPVSLSPEDAQFIETMRWSHTEVATAFNIPASRLNGDGGGSLRYANLAQDDEAFFKQACMPRLAMVEAALNRDPDLFGFQSPWVPRFNFDELLRADKLTRYQIYQIGRQIGVESPNSILEQENRSPRIGGDIYQDALTKTPTAGDVSTNGAPGQVGKSQQRGAGVDEVAELRAILERLEAKKADPSVQIKLPDSMRMDIPTPVVNVNVPKQEPPVVNVSVPEQPAPVVEVNVPEQPAPVVNVDVPVPQVTVEAPQVTVDAPVLVNEPAGPKVVSIKRDKQGRISGAEVVEQ